MFVGRHASEIIGALGIGQDRPDLGGLVNRALAGEEATTTLRIGAIVFDMRLVPLYDANGDIKGVIGVSTDVTERVRAQEELRKTLTELERRGEEMESFNYSVSHDLKEPLRTIEAFSKFVLEDYADQVDDQGRDYLQRMGKAAARLKQMIEELFTLSRIGRRPDTLHRVDIAAVVGDIVAAMQIAVQEKRATIEIEDTLSPVLADESRVEQIFGNLIANSLKFNHNEQPRITIGQSGIEGGMAVFFVRDNGIGIDEQYHDRIFQVFQRLHRREDYEGTGAGLAIVKRAVHALSGQIWLTSSAGEGATFFVALPVWRPEHAAIEQAQAVEGKAAVHAEV
jgi:light-regulated signal transduction histidine kinase (bacteriophytochrome)